MFLAFLSFTCQAHYFVASFICLVARVVKLVDTQCSERCGRNPMGVRVPPRAHKLNNLI